MATFRSGTGWIELLRPLDPEGAIARFLAKRGESVSSHRLRQSLIWRAARFHAEAGVRLIDDSRQRTGGAWLRIPIVSGVRPTEASGPVY